MPFGLPQPADVLSSEVEGDGPLSNILNIESAKVPTPPAFAEPPLTPSAPRPALPAQLIADPTGTPGTPSPSPPSPQNTEEIPVDHDEEDSPDKGPNLSLPQTTAPPPVPSVPATERQEFRGVASDESEEYEDEPPTLYFDPTSVVSDGVEDEDFSSVDAEPVEVPTSPPPSLTFQSVLSAELIPGRTKTPETAPYPQPPPTLTLPQQSLGEGSGDPSNEHGPDEHGPGGGGRTDEHFPDGEESDRSLSLQVGRPLVIPPLLLTTTSQPKAETQESHGVASDESEYEGEPPTVSPDVHPPADINSDKGEGEGFSSDVMIVAPAEVPTSPSFADLPSTSLTSRSAQPTPDPTETPGTTSSPQPPSPTPLPHQSLKEGSDGPSEEDGSDVHGSDGGDSPQGDSSGEEEPSLSLPIDPVSLSIPSEMEAETEEAGAASSHESEDYDLVESATVPFDFSQSTGFDLHPQGEVGRRDPPEEEVLAGGGNAFSLFIGFQH